MDSFKKYLLKNKSRLELEEPGDTVWNHIEFQIGKPQKNILAIRITKWVTAACIITLAGFGLYSLIRVSPKPNGQYVQIAPADTSANSRNELPIPQIKPEDSFPSTSAPKIKTERPVRSLSSQNRKKITNPGPDNFIQQSLIGFVAEIENQKTIICSSPVFGVSQEYFSSFIVQFKNLEQGEKELKNKIKVSGVTSELLDGLVQNLKRRITILIQLKAEIDKVNVLNEDKVYEKNYIKII